MPPKKPSPPQGQWVELWQWFKKMDGTTAYRLAMFFAILSITPFASLLPKIEGYKPLWSTVKELEATGTANTEKLDEVITKVERLEHKTQQLEQTVDKVDSRVMRAEATLTGFQVDFERYRQPVPPRPVTQPNER